MEENTNKISKVPQIAGVSNFVNEIKQLIDSVSEKTFSVCLYGEKGTGKKLFAQTVHLKTSKNLRNFVEINCRSFDENTINELLQSYAQLDSVDSKITLFVNYIEELSAGSQSVFLDAVKSFSAKQLNLQIISSTEYSQDKLKEVLNGELLFYLKNIQLNFIPLRNRKEDIIPVSNYYLERFNKGSGLKLQGFTNAAIQALQDNFWTGNADELINCIQHAFIVCKTKTIDCADLTLGTNSMEKLDMTLKDAVDGFKRDYITKVLEANNWNQTKTAKVLGIQRTYVIKLINELQIKKN